MDAPERRGVIDSVATGFQITHLHLPFLLIPVSLDLFLWLGPKVSVRPLLDGVFGSPTTALADLGANAGAPAAEQLTTSLTGFNLISVLALVMPTSRPFIIESAQESSAITIATWPMAIALVLVFFAAAVLIGALYRSTVVQGVLRPSAWSGDDIYRTFLAAAPHYVRLLLLVLGIATAGMVVASLVTSLFEAIVPGAGGLVIVLLSGVVLWLVILFFLSESAVFVSGYGALASLQASARIVRTYLWPSVGLFFLVRLIGFGMGIIWGRVGDASLVTIAAIGGNAYIATGLTLAAMVYYRDRIDSMRWNP